MYKKNKILALILLILQCFITNLTAIAQSPIYIQLKWKHQFQFAGYYAAVNQGYFKDLGLNVSLKEGGQA